MVKFCVRFASKTNKNQNEISYLVVILKADSILVEIGTRILDVIPEIFKKIINISFLFKLVR